MGFFTNACVVLLLESKEAHLCYEHIENVQCSLLIRDLRRLSNVAANTYRFSNVHNMWNSDRRRPPSPFSPPCHPPFACKVTEKKNIRTMLFFVVNQKKRVRDYFQRIRKSESIAYFTITTLSFLHVRPDWSSHAEYCYKILLKNIVLRLVKSRDINCGL